MSAFRTAEPVQIEPERTLADELRDIVEQAPDPAKVPLSAVDFADAVETAKRRMREAAAKRQYEVSFSVAHVGMTAFQHRQIVDYFRAQDIRVTRPVYATGDDFYNHFTMAWNKLIEATDDAVNHQIMPAAPTKRSWWKRFWGLL